MSKDIELPEGWEHKRLGDIFSVSSGKGIKVNGLTGGRYAVYGGNGINGYHNEYTLEEERLIIGRVGVKCGVTHITKPKSWVTDNALIVTPKSSDFNIKFFKLKLEHENLNKLSVSTAQPVISGSKIYAYEIIVPKLAEQNAIVEKIEELFSELDKGIENLKTAQQQLKVYRQAVLKFAFEGKLTNDNVIKGELPNGWILVKTKDVINTINNGYTPTKEFLSEGSGEIPFIKVYNLNFDGTLNFSKNPTYIPQSIHKKDLKRSICEPGDVLINIVGPPLGKVSIVTNQFPEWNINQAIVLFKPNDKVISKYISYFLQNPTTINWLEGTSKATAGQWNVKVSTCREIPLPICSVEEQFLVVKEIESRLSVCDKMEETITNSLEQAEALKQSILKQAFEGKLVKMDNAKKTAKVVSINAKRDVWQRKVLAGKIIFSCHKERSFGTTKFQKLLYLCEQHAQLDFDTHYVKQTAGPLDATFIYPFIREAETQQWFVQESDNATIHRFKPQLGLGKLTTDYPKYFKEPGNKINFVINLLKDKNTDESELIATIYAIWNNYLISGLKLQATELVKEVYKWSESKAKFKSTNITSTWGWMKEVRLVPSGFGKIIVKV